MVGQNDCQRLGVIMLWVQKQKEEKNVMEVFFIAHEKLNCRII